MSDVPDAHVGETSPDGQWIWDGNAWQPAPAPGPAPIPASSAPPPQVSPDGKFYWDGRQWVQMRDQTPSQSRNLRPAIALAIVFLLPEALYIGFRLAGLETGLSWWFLLCLAIAVIYWKLSGTPREGKF
jgi:hypothetical protein